MDAYQERVLNKLDELSKTQAELREEMRVGFAQLPNQYVTRREIEKTKNAARDARRYALTTMIAVIGLGIPIGLQIF